MIIDIGNTRCKWLRNNVLKYCSYTKLESLQIDCKKLTSTDSIYYSSVSPAKLEEIISLNPNFQGKRINIRSLIPEIQISNLSNISNIGSDRLFGAIGARFLSNGNVMSVDCGTATTINCLSSSNEFVGGMIFPGYMTQKTALLSKTAIHSQCFENADKILSLSTADAIHSGIVSNTCGAILLAFEEFSKNISNVPSVFITGGNYHYFSSRLVKMGIKHTFDPFLVMRGMASILRQNINVDYFVKY